MSDLLRAIATVILVYIGNKPFKEDNVCKSGVTWIGYGDKQPVDRKNLAEYLKHPQVWVTEEEFEKMPKRNATTAIGNKVYVSRDNGDGTFTLIPQEQINSEINQEDTQTDGNTGPVVTPEGVESFSNPDSDEGDAPDPEPEPDVPDIQSGASILVKIKNAILSLDQENEAHFTKTGSPKVFAVQALVDVEINAKDVAAAWDELKSPAA